MKSLCRIVGLAALCGGTMLLGSCSSAVGLANSALRTVRNAPSGATKLATRTVQRAPGTAYRTVRNAPSGLVGSAARTVQRAPGSVTSTAGRLVQAANRSLTGSY